MSVQSGSSPRPSISGDFGTLMVHILDAQGLKAVDSGGKHIKDSIVFYVFTRHE